MRKSYLLVAAALLVAASCQKNDNASSVEGIKYNPIDVVLSAAIEDVDTKVGYTEDANALKAAWKAGDKISLVALDASGNVLSNDVFETTTAGPVAKFNGTYSNPAGAVTVSVFYPALTQGKGTSAEPWHCESDALFNMVLGNGYMNISTFAPHYQEMNADPAFLSKSVVMKGKISDMSAFMSGAAKTTLKNTCYIIKTTVTLPSTVTKVSDVRLVASSSTITVLGWTYVDDEFMISYGGATPNDYHKICTRLGNFAPASDGTVTAWMIGYVANKFEVTSGETLTVSVNTDQGVISRVKTLTSNITFESGKIYRLTVDMTK